MVDSYREHLEAQAQRRDELVTQTLRFDLAHALRLYEIALDVTPSLVVGLDLRGCIRLVTDHGGTRRRRQPAGPHMLPLDGPDRD